MDLDSVEVDFITSRLSLISRDVSHVKLPRGGGEGGEVRGRLFKVVDILSSAGGTVFSSPFPCTSGSPGSQTKCYRVREYLAQTELILILRIYERIN
jgi:hypothetical protein